MTSQRFPPLSFPPLSSVEQSLVNNIQEKKLLPLISNITTNELVFGNQKEVIKSWAKNMMKYSDEEIETLSTDHNTLHWMIQRWKVNLQANPDKASDDSSIKREYLKLLNTIPTNGQETPLDYNSLSFAERLQKSSTETSEQNPLHLLANLPIPIYLTTSYHTSIEIALKRANKEPQTGVFPWNTSYDTFPNPFDDASYIPTVEKPLVYHFHGLDSILTSLVLTEDDYLDFLVAISRKRKLIPKRIQGAIAESALMMLGYSVADWDFRVLFRGLIKTIENSNRPTSVHIQVEDETEKIYLETYFKEEAKLKVLWGSIQQVLQPIYQEWQVQYPTAKTSTTSEGVVGELTSEQKRMLVDKLLEARYLQDERSRTAIVSQLRFDIRSNIVLGGTPRLDTVNIVNTALAYRNGLNDLLATVRHFEGDSLAMQAIDKLLATYREAK